MKTTHVRLIGEGILLVGLVLFVLGAGLVVSGYGFDPSIAILGALALIFVGVGNSIKNRHNPPTG